MSTLVFRTHFECFWKPVGICIMHNYVSALKMLQLWMSINLKHLTKHNTHSGDPTLLVKHALLGKQAVVTRRLCNNIFYEMYVRFQFRTMSWFYHECSWVVCLLTITLKPSSLYSHLQYNYSTRQGFVWIFLSDRSTYM